MTKSVSKSQENGEDKKAEQEKILHVEMKNCFGIKSLEHTFDFSGKNVIAIYARNGSGKSSFCRAFECYQNGKVIRDEVTAEQGSLKANWKEKNKKEGEEVKSVIVCRMDDENLKEAFENLDFIQTKNMKKEDAMINARRNKFKNIIKSFQKHFHFPFSISSEHIDCFTRGKGGKQIYPHDKIFSLLSKGEQSTFCFLKAYSQMLMSEGNGKDGKTGKKEKEETLILLDDIADMFDSRHRLSMLSYLQDEIRKGSHRYWIIFSHNYDFFNTLSSRLGLHRNNRLSAVDEEDGSIKLVPDTGNPFKYWCTKAGHKATDNEKEKPEYIGDQCFLCLIPMIRQLISWTKNTDKDPEKKDNTLLTKLLHYFKDTEKITCEKVIEVFEKYNTKQVGNSKKVEEEAYPDLNRSQKVWDLLMNTCEKVVGNKKKRALTLEDKMVLAMASRLKAEQFMINKGECQATGTNQTRELVEQYAEKHPRSGNVQILYAVVTLLPDFIHCNAFSYEPLMDLDGSELLDLYKKVDELGTKKGENSNQNKPVQKG